ncbi:MFS transporter [Streptomyces iranensis]|uniref:MFS transporter n=1 Tax=Streptomyces iranensis TaxID=576784 RepID=UPI0039B76710
MEAALQNGAPPQSDGSAAARRWWVLGAVVLAQLMVVLDGTVVNIALPSAQTDLGFSDGNRQWIVTGYSLAFGGLLLLGGRVSDMIGRKRAFLAGLVGFAAASALGGAADGFGVLVAARVLQGAAGALLAPTALAVLATTFTAPRERARAFGVFSAAAGAGSAIGVLLGGFLTEGLNWRWTLYINVFIAVVAAAAATVSIGRTPRRGPRPALDIPGAVLVSAGLFALVLGFSEAETDGWAAPPSWASLTASALLLVAFAARQRRTAHPLLPPGVLLDRDRAAGYSGILLASVGMFGVLLFVNYYLQDSLDYSPIRTGLAFLPMVVLLVIGSQLATNVFLPRLGHRRVVPTGMALGAVGMALLTGLEPDSTYTTGVLPALLLIGFGIGNVITSSFQAGTSGVDPGTIGVASAVVNTSQQIGGSIGTALLNTLATAATGHYLAAHGTSPAATAQAATHGYAVAYWWGAGTYTAGALLTTLLYRHKRRPTPQPST